MIPTDCLTLKNNLIFLCSAQRVHSTFAVFYIEVKTNLATVQLLYIFTVYYTLL